MNKYIGMCCGQVTDNVCMSVGAKYKAGAYLLGDRRTVTIMVMW